MIEDIFKLIPPPELPRDLVRALSDLGGYNEYGEPILKFEWGGDAVWFRGGRRRCKYPIPGPKPKKLTGCNVLQQRDGKLVFYAVGTDPLVAPGDVIDQVYERLNAGIPRWFLVEWRSPEVLMSGRAANQFDRIDGKRVDILGDLPERGEYRPTGLVFETQDGQYCPPTFQHLELIRKFRDEIEASNSSIREPLDEHRAQAIVNEYWDQMAERDRRLDEEYADNNYQALKFWKRRLTAEHPNEGYLSHRDRKASDAAVKN